MAYRLSRMAHRCKHGFVSDFCDWLYSSYHTLLSDKPTRLERAAVLDWFGGVCGMRELHAAEVDEQALKMTRLVEWCSVPVLACLSVDRRNG